MYQSAHVTCQFTAIRSYTFCALSALVLVAGSLGCGKTGPEAGPAVSAVADDSRSSSAKSEPSKVVPSPTTKPSVVPPAPSEIICPAMPRVAHAVIQLAKPLFDGHYDVVFTEGSVESCVIDVSASAPSTKLCPTPGVPCMVSSPTTRTSTTCKRLSVSGIADSGAVANLSVAGTPPKFSIKLLKSGKLLGEDTFSPTYTPDPCGFISPAVTLPMP